MRTPKYLSPTSVHLFMDSPEDFYIRYLSEVIVPRDPQTQPMSIGSAFDAYCKSYLHEKLFGKGRTKGSRFELDTIFTEQVAKHNRDWAWEHGKFVFEEYKKAGCLADLMLELNQAVGEPRFELSIEDTVETEVGDVPLLGKPDVFFINSEGARVVYDWKVNGYCAARNTSPMKGYIKLKTKTDDTYYNSMHKKCVLKMVKGILINDAMCLEDGNKGWADQLCIYSWLLGEPVGSEEVIFGIDQVVGPMNKLRFATHRLQIRPDYHYNLLVLIESIWSAITNNHIFQDLNVDESRARCELLEEMLEKKTTLSEEEQKTFASLCE